MLEGIKIRCLVKNNQEEVLRLTIGNSSPIQGKRMLLLAFVLLNAKATQLFDAELYPLKNPEEENVFQTLYQMDFAILFPNKQQLELFLQDLQNGDIFL